MLTHLYEYFIVYINLQGTRVYIQTRARLKYDLNGRDMSEGSWGLD
jgi:hypothetical protein